MKIDKSTVKNSGAIKPKKNLSATIIAAVIMVLLIGVVYFTLSKVLAKEKYYVLTTDVSAKTQVTTNMLKEIVTAKGTSPQNAISIAEVRQGGVFTKYPLKAGDILSESNTGAQLDSAGIPEDWVRYSFNISADDAVAGNITRGDYFDVLVTIPEEGSKYVAFNLLALEVNYNQQGTALDTDGKVVPIGETLQYVVGLPPEKLPDFKNVFDTYDDISLALSPVSLKYKARPTENLNGIASHGARSDAYDLYEGTDSSFTPVLRDENGRPVNKTNCELGRISPAELCEQLPKDESSNTRQQPDTVSVENEDGTTDEVFVPEVNTPDNNENIEPTEAAAENSEENADGR